MVEVTLYEAWRDDLRGVQRRRGPCPAGTVPGILLVKNDMKRNNITPGFPRAMVAWRPSSGILLPCYTRDGQSTPQPCTNVSGVEVQGSLAHKEAHPTEDPAVGLQGYLTHKEKRDPPRTTIGPYA